MFYNRGWTVSNSTGGPWCRGLPASEGSPWRHGSRHQGGVLKARPGHQMGTYTPACTITHVHTQVYLPHELLFMNSIATAPKAEGTSMLAKVSANAEEGGLFKMQFLKNLSLR